MTQKTDNKTVDLDALEEKYPDPLPSLVGVDGNAFSVLVHFSKNARKAGWDSEDIEAVKNEAMSGSYNHLLNTISFFTE